MINRNMIVVVWNIQSDALTEHMFVWMAQGQW
jgi:hypothetical protein